MKKYSRRKLRKKIKEKHFEFISPGDPQKNGVLERLFTTIYFWMCVMIVHTVLHEKLNYFLWPKLLATATKLENIMVNPHKGKCAHEKFYGKIQTMQNI